MPINRSIFSRAVKPTQDEDEAAWGNTRQDKVMAVDTDVIYKVLTGEKLSSAEIQKLLSGRGERIFAGEILQKIKELYPECFI